MTNTMLNAVMSGEFNFNEPNWENIPSELVNFIKLLLEPDHSKRSKSILAISNRWIISLTKGKKNVERKVLENGVLLKLKKFIAEYRLLQSINEMIQ